MQQIIIADFAKASTQNNTKNTTNKQKNHFILIKRYISSETTLISYSGN